MFATKKKKKSLEQTVLAIQKGDGRLQNDLIEDYKPFIAKTVSSICKRYIEETDDEFSIGLIAFNEAVEKYSSEKGRSLLSFAEVLIKRRVIDYIRKNAKNQSLRIQMDQEEQEYPFRTLDQELSFEQYQVMLDDEKRKEEILHYRDVLLQYDLHFSDLVEQSPKHIDARVNAIKIATLIVENQELYKILNEKKRLPIKQLEEKVQVSRKTIERNRKFIIAVAIILGGDYRYLKEYIKGVISL